jgi:TolB-like protein
MALTPTHLEAAAAPPGPFSLGLLQVDPASRRVTCPAGRCQTLEPRVMQVLMALARAGGQIMAREELLRICWSGLPVGEDSLTRAIGRLRRLSQELVTGAFAIETIARVGYRLVAVSDGDVQSSFASPRQAAIAVLPFRNLSGSPLQKPLADAICEDVVTALAHWRRLFVVAKGPGAGLQCRDLEPAGIAAGLGARSFVTGSVRLNAQILRIAIQLSDTATGASLWSERFEGELSDKAALRDDVARRVAAAVEPALLAWDSVRHGLAGAQNGRFDRFIGE